MELTFGELIDKLITASNKCWHAQDKIMEPGASAEEVAKAAKLAQLANIDRAKLVRDIDSIFGQAREIDSFKSYERKK